jgi:hypothetical protein
MKKLVFSLCFAFALLSTAQGACTKNISFAWASGGTVWPTIPAWTEKWIAKNQQKHSEFCFTQSPLPGLQNYLLVFSTSNSAFSGIQPSVRTSTSTSTSPVAGNGTINNYSTGQVWSYNYSGTETTTTTTAYTAEVPYTLESRTLYLNAYDQIGLIISGRFRTISTQQGGDPYAALGQNLGALISEIHLKAGLLEHVLQDVGKDCDHGKDTITARCSYIRTMTASATDGTALHEAPNAASAPPPPPSPPVHVASLGLLQPSSDTNTAIEAPSHPTPTLESAGCGLAIESHIDGAFNGWDDQTIYKLDNGQIWQQSIYHYHYHYAFHPGIVIYKSASGACHARVTDDDDDGVDVIRLK